LTDLEKLRAFAQGLIDEAGEIVAECGVAGGHLELARAETAKGLIALLDSMQEPPFIDVVFDGPPGHEAGRFVEVEDSSGKSVRVGDWIDRGNGLWALRIPSQSLPTLISPDLIPPQTRQSMDDYAAHGLQPGQCLRAVLAGDLFEAMSRADDEILLALPAIVTYIRSSLPAGCWGSQARVQAWIARPRS